MQVEASVKSSKCSLLEGLQGALPLVFSHMETRKKMIVLMKRKILKKTLLMEIKWKLKRSLGTLKQRSGEEE